MELNIEKAGNNGDVDKTSKPEIDEWIGDAVNAAVNNNTRTIYFESVQDGEMRINYAARKSGVSVADFTESMRKGGYEQ